MNIMHNTDKWLDDEIKYCREKRYRFSRRLKQLPSAMLDERLACKVIRGRNYYSEVWVEDGERKLRYLGTEDNRDVLEIREVHFLKKAMLTLDKKIQMLESSRDKIRPIGFDEINASMPKVYRLSAEHLSEVVGPDCEEKWYIQALKEKASLDERHKAGYQSGRVHTAKDGTMMRSKSEVSIANELINRGIPYIYEMPVKVNGIWMHPDFRFFSLSRSKPMIWEHAGMMGDNEYKNDFSRKLDTYINGGYVPCVDVVFTFDTTDGNIDTRMIDAILDEYR